MDSACGSGKLFGFESSMSYYLKTLFFLISFTYIDSKHSQELRTLIRFEARASMHLPILAVAFCLVFIGFVLPADLLAEEKPIG